MRNGRNLSVSLWCKHIQRVSHPGHHLTAKMKLSLYEINFDNPQGVFLAGSSVSGIVRIHLTKPMKMKAIKLHFDGKARTHWTISRSRSRVHYKAVESYLNHCVTLFKPETGDSAMHPAGNHTYPFSLRLLESVPSSFESKKGYIRYFCKSTIERPWKFDSHLKRVFTVIHNLDLNTVPSALIPIDAYVVKEVQGWCCSAGNVHVNLSLNKTGYVPGEPIAYDISINNETDYKIKTLTLQLIQVTTYTGYSGAIFSTGHPKYYDKRIDFELIAEKVVVKQHSSSMIKQGTLVPSLPPSCLDGCSIINIKYLVELKVICNGTKLTISREVTVGTIPTRDPMYQYPLVSSSSGFGVSVLSTGSDPSRNLEIPAIALDFSEANRHVEHTAPPPYDEALGPPPSYSECVLGSTLIRDEEDNDHTVGDVNWAPVYPYYDWSLRSHEVESHAVAQQGANSEDDHED